MNKRKIIIDCDPGIDDSLAIMLALTSPEIEVLGITIVCGNSPVEMGFENAKKILKQMNRLDVPVYMGEPRPLKRDYVNAPDTHGADGLGESFLPEVPGYQQEIGAVDFLSKALIKEKVSVIALGPMTNLARLIQKAPAAFDQIEELVSMGGSFKSHGNCSPVAEYNYWCDPDAAALVYDTLHQNGKMIHMIGLDVTRKIVLTPTLLEYICRLNKETGEFIRKITKFYFDFHWEWEHIIGCVINDPLAVAYFINPELCKGFDSYVQIETEGISLGQSVVDSMNFYRKTSNARVLTEVDVYGFFQMFLSRILDQEPEELDILQDLIRGDLK
jgi:purine nucleosidase